MRTVASLIPKLQAVTDLSRLTWRSEKANRHTASVAGFLFTVEKQPTEVRMSLSKNDTTFDDVALNQDESQALIQAIQRQVQRRGKPLIAISRALDRLLAST